ncbi:unnamed protein product, partial [Protopolystoma xenopodis]
MWRSNRPCCVRRRRLGLRLRTNRTNTIQTSLSSDPTLYRPSSSSQSVHLHTLLHDTSNTGTTRRLETGKLEPPLPSVSLASYNSPSTTAAIVVSSPRVSLSTSPTALYSSNSLAKLGLRRSSRLMLRHTSTTVPNEATAKAISHNTSTIIASNSVSSSSTSLNTSGIAYTPSFLPTMSVSTHAQFGLSCASTSILPYPNILPPDKIEVSSITGHQPVLIRQLAKPASNKFPKLAEAMQISDLPSKKKQRRPRSRIRGRELLSSGKNCFTSPSQKQTFAASKQSQIEHNDQPDNDCKEFSDLSMTETHPPLYLQRSPLPESFLESNLIPPLPSSNINASCSNMANSIIPDSEPTIPDGNYLSKNVPTLSLVQLSQLPHAGNLGTQSSSTRKTLNSTPFSEPTVTIFSSSISISTPITKQTGERAEPNSSTSHALSHTVSSPILTSNSASIIGCREFQTSVDPKLHPLFSNEPLVTPTQLRYSPREEFQDLLTPLPLPSTSPTRPPTPSTQLDFSLTCGYADDFFGSQTSESSSFAFTQCSDHFISPHPSKLVTHSAEVAWRPCSDAPSRQEVGRCLKQSSVITQKVK